MPRLTITASNQQINEVIGLVDKIGVGPYRDAKSKAGVDRMKSFSQLTRLEADTVIGILKEQLRTRK